MKNESADKIAKRLLLESRSNAGVGSMFPIRNEIKHGDVYYHTTSNKLFVFNKPLNAWESYEGR